MVPRCTVFKLWKLSTVADKISKQAVRLMTGVLERKPRVIDWQNHRRGSAHLFVSERSQPEWQMISLI